jgi:iron(III) transport system substrate-binding protein
MSMVGSSSVCRWLTAVVGGATAVALLTGCGALSGTSSSGAKTLVVYDGQRPATTQALAAAFTKATGITVRIRNGSDAQLAGQIEQEGAHSPADVVFTEDSPAMTALSQKGLLAPAPAAAVREIPADYRSPRNDWTGVAGRETVLYYNPGQTDAARLPGSLLDLASPAWKGTIGVAPATADFQSQVSAVIALEGPAKAKSWLEGIKRNARVYQNNNAVLQAVDRGQVDTGIAYQPLWYRARAESPSNTAHVRMHYFAKGDPGAFFALACAGELRNAPDKAAAARFIDFLTSVEGQNDLASVKDFEYPLNPKATPAPDLEPTGELGVPDVPVAKLDGAQAQQLLSQVGLI